MLQHCPGCSCGGAARPLADDPEWQALMERSAETDREILAILDECDRLALVGREAPDGE